MLKKKIKIFWRLHFLKLGVKSRDCRTRVILITWQGHKLSHRLVLLIGPLLSQPLIQKVHIDLYTESPNKTKSASPHKVTGGAVTGLSRFSMHAVASMWMDSIVMEKKLGPIHWTTVDEPSIHRRKCRIHELTGFVLYYF